jgi:hypothetical protein
VESFDISRLRQGEKIAGGSAAALLIVLFVFKWFGYKGAGANFAGSLGINLSLTGWQSITLTRWLILITIIIALGTAFITATQRTVALPVAGSVMTAAGGIVITILVFYRVVISHPGSNSLIGAKFGAYLGLLFCIGIAVGGWRSMQDEGTSFREAGDQFGSTAASRAETRPAPPAAPSAPPPPAAPPVAPPAAPLPPAAPREGPGSAS